MNVKNNKRKRASREKIETAFIELLQIKDFNEITVSEIIKITGLNRSTFYANYDDIFSLAEAIGEKLEKEVEELYNGNSNKYNEYDYLKLFYHIKENQIFYKTYFKLGYENKEIDLSELYSYSKIFPKDELAYHVAFFRAGFNAIIKKWLFEGCKKTPEEINEIFKNEYKNRT